MKKVILSFLLLLPLWVSAQSPLGEAVTKGNLYLQVMVMPRSVINTLNFKVTVVANRRSQDVEDDRGKPYTFLNWQEIFEYLDQEGWVYYTHVKSVLMPEDIETMVFVRR